MGCREENTYRTNIDAYIAGTILQCVSDEPVERVQQVFFAQHPFRCAMRGEDGEAGHSVILNPDRIAAAEIWDASKAAPEAGDSC